MRSRWIRFSAKSEIYREAVPKKKADRGRSISSLSRFCMCSNHGLLRQVTRPITSMSRNSLPNWVMHWHHRRGSARFFGNENEHEKEQHDGNEQPHEQQHENEHEKEQAARRQAASRAPRRAPPPPPRCRRQVGLHHDRADGREAQAEERAQETRTRFR